MQQTEKVPLPDDKLITVCASCLRATCWYYMFLCDNYLDADITQKTVKELRELNREHGCYWYEEDFV